MFFFCKCVPPVCPLESLFFDVSVKAAIVRPGGKKMKKITVSDKVYALITSTTHAFSTREILSRISAGESSIKKALQELTVSKKISKVRHGVYVDPSFAWMYERK